eukprot:CAMPEP_0195571864 /NCGR_PEP_ID=MMETSP0814-20130614/4359_1 /TAXON_ID=97485 /ORGANISM="Prymnesium parvum, Strain Texoma1" /LENGTH=121 /DNA_ID=CAMNT_0040707541 /DNA_START=18 /DNA_END=378 /DNA_ORIENTATION=+
MAVVAEDLFLAVRAATQAMDGFLWLANPPLSLHMGCCALAMRTWAVEGDLGSVSKYGSHTLPYLSWVGHNDAHDTARAVVGAYVASSCRMQSYVASRKPYKRRASKLSYRGTTVCGFSVHA